MDEKLTEADICTKFITPAIVGSVVKWNGCGVSSRFDLTFPDAILGAFVPAELASTQGEPSPDPRLAVGVHLTPTASAHPPPLAPTARA